MGQVWKIILFSTVCSKTSLWVEYTSTSLIWNHELNHSNFKTKHSFSENCFWIHYGEYDQTLGVTWVVLLKTHMVISLISIVLYSLEYPGTSKSMKNHGNTMFGQIVLHPALLCTGPKLVHTNTPNPLFTLISMQCVFKYWAIKIFKDFPFLFIQIPLPSVPKKA